MIDRFIDRFNDMIYASKAFENMIFTIGFIIFVGIGVGIISLIIAFPVIGLSILAVILLTVITLITVYAYKESK